MSELLVVDDVKVHFGGVKAVDGISFELESGVLYGLVGPNGSGKSTLLGAFSRLTDVTSGRLTFEGREYTRATAQRVARSGIARTFQTVRLLPFLSVLENVMLGADVRLGGTGIVKNWLMPWRTRSIESECRHIAEEAIEKLELEDYRVRPAGVLPYGVQRRVEIARTVASKPKLILFDEPTAGMSRGERDRIGEVMISLRQEGITQVLVEHDMQMITNVCEHVFVMNFGEMIAQGNPVTVVQNSRVQEAYLGKRGEHDAAS